ncbi:MAG TPA: alpha/beta fold hydrolase [Rheinheimera sp.]|nr:alpha/beta fold hydrolase [Rheinheimera sp.]
MYKNEWFIVPKPKPAAKLRLFCFPYAGGQAAIYFPLARLLPEQIELVAVQLPGRGNRMFEPALTSAQDIARAVVPQILPHADKPIALLGYSNGCLQAYEVAHLLQQRADVRHVFMAARSAPQLGNRREPIHLLADQQFKQELALLGGTPQELLAYDELMELMLPTLRADFKLGYDYQCPQAEPLAIDLTSIAGRFDQDIPGENVQAWRQLFAAGCQHHLVDGDHFFINTHLADMARIIELALQPHYQQAPTSMVKTKVALSG